MDLALEGGDLAIERGDLVLVDGIAAVEQHLRIRLKTFKGEWFLDTRVGMPYFQGILVKNPSLSVIRSIYRRGILSTPGVLSVESLNLSLNRATRMLSVSFTAKTSAGPLSYAEEVEI